MVLASEDEGDPPPAKETKNLAKRGSANNLLKGFLLASCLLKINNEGGQFAHTAPKVFAFQQSLEAKFRQACAATLFL